MVAGSASRSRTRRSSAEPAAASIKIRGAVSPTGQLRAHIVPAGVARLRRSGGRWDERDLAANTAGLESRERGRRLLEWQYRVDKRPHGASLDQRAQPVERRAPRRCEDEVQLRVAVPRLE